jgi:type IV secretion system protein VirB5
MTEPSGQTGSPPEGENPYLAARREWNERYGDYIAAAHTWRRAAMLALSIAVIATAGAVWTGSQNRLVPYVVQVDRLGTAVAVNRADLAQAPDNRLITAQLARWVTAARSVYADASAQRALLKEAYGMVNRNGAALNTLNDYMRAHDPFERAASETVSVEVQSVLAISRDSWRIEWREEVRGRDGALARSTQYQATAAISFNPPSDEAAIQINPAGLYINSFSWAQRL